MLDKESNNEAYYENTSYANFIAFTKQPTLTIAEDSVDHKEK